MSDVVVWEWEDSNKWQPYEAKVSNGIEKAYLPFFAKSQRKTTFNLNFIKNKILSQDVVSLKQFDTKLSYEIDFNSMLQKNVRTGMLRSVRRQTYALDSAIGKGIVWGYQSSTASVVYSNDVGAILEDAYMRNLKMVHLGMTTLNVPFTVYIDKMTQSNNFSGEEFKVLRDVMLDKYTLDKIPQSSAKAPPIRRAKSYASPMVRGRPSQARPTPTASFVTGAAVSLPGQAQRVSPLLFGGSSSQYGQPTSSNAAHQPYFIPSLTSNSVSSARFMAPSSFKKPVSASPSFPMSTAAVKFPNRSLTRQSTSAVPKSGSVTNDRGFRDEAKHLSALEIVAQFADSAVPSEGECPICCADLKSASGFCEGASGGDPAVIQLKRCKHAYHTDCMVAMYENSAKNGCLQCPTCKTIYGMKTGICPRGRMYYEKKSFPLPGHSDCGCIEITYHIVPGTQVLRLLMEAFERRLTFTLGTSVTTGLRDTVVWNEIHHKSTIDNSSGHGYPDPNYLQNVTAELAAQGVTLVDEWGSS